ncbi:MAG: hypothetical protein PVG71_13505 [Anaerolineae bacterium]|jgi:hypothetical protein
MTDESLDRILARCLEEAEQSGDIGAVLRDHPEHADELRPLLELASVARRIYEDVAATARAAFLARSTVYHVRELERYRAGDRQGRLR